MASPALVWFRDDFRLSDHPALAAASASGLPLLCFAILDEETEGLRPRGGAARWWLHGSLKALDRSLRDLGGELLLFKGRTDDLVRRIASETSARALFWNRRYESAEIAVDSRLKTRLSDAGLSVETFNGRLLHEPWAICNQAGQPYRVFTPYSRAARDRPVPAPLAPPRAITTGTWPPSLQTLAVPLAELALEPTRPNWAEGLAATWERGEKPARDALAEFVDSRLRSYADDRDRPGIDGSSRLSPHLHHGEISPRQVWHAVMAAKAHNPALERGADKFLTELIWRDFCWQVLYQYPDLPRATPVEAFRHMAWSESRTALAAWQRGMTGYPIVDAGMRQLWTTGWMHNRVRMIVASFLTKHLLIDWRRGEEWFWDTLVDADCANNAFNWQWVAGSGPDSAPFHRIFNPILQSEKFDPAGAYIRTFAPELSGLPDRYLHAPWAAPAAALEAAAIRLGETYPRPVVDHAAARQRALAAFQAARQASA